ncbi:uncharacterized protein BXZ73DRAFT_98610 [Epithele typhae]|uniref:uncharacterized protein n=1 Tax=Epithele typhae TaxID=378194 RepID=UPI002008BA14|nr:uncharacterized protein BXZ73DRAFT_98610 [Epithele typhae]KAH9940782.1 hypothetical protein BXZ73DRAFT_98610 [Epithele typhae]
MSSLKIKASSHRMILHRSPNRIVVWRRRASKWITAVPNGVGEGSEDGDGATAVGDEDMVVDVVGDENAAVDIVGDDKDAGKPGEVEDGAVKPDGDGTVKSEEGDAVTVDNEDSDEDDEADEADDDDVDGGIWIKEDRVGGLEPVVWPRLTFRDAWMFMPNLVAASSRLSTRTAADQDVDDCHEFFEPLNKPHDVPFPVDDDGNTITTAGGANTHTCHEQLPERWKQPRQEAQNPAYFVRKMRRPPPSFSPASRKGLREDCMSLIKRLHGNGSARNPSSRIAED